MREIVIGARVIGEMVIRERVIPGKGIGGGTMGRLSATCPFSE
jgi:hypothetical protein